MKKIFLPLLALVGMVTGFTLTSCGGGGGGNSGFAGKTYYFGSWSTSSMTMVCDANGIGNSFSATLMWDGDTTTQSHAKVTMSDATYSENGELQSCVLNFYGVEADVMSDAGVQTFFGLANAAVDEDSTQSIGFSIYLNQVPKKVGEVVDKGNYIVAVYVDFDNDEEADDEEVQNPDPNALPPNSTQVPVVCERIE